MRKAPPMVASILQSVGHALRVAGVVLIVAAFCLASIFLWPDAWREWLTQYWSVLGQEAGGLSIFMYVVASFSSGIALAVVGSLTMTLAAWLEKPAD